MQIIHDIQYIHYDSVDSTHIIARNFHGDADVCYVFTANVQTGGIGKGSHCWESPRGNLYVSMLLSFSGDASLISLLVCCAVHEVIKETCTKDDVRIHWPNDIYVNGKKVCGILLEIPDKNRLIISIGINTISTPSNLTNLADKLNFRDNNLLLNKIINNINRWYTKAVENKSIVRDYCMKNVLGLHHNIVVKYNKAQIEGVFKEIDNNFRIVVTCHNGEEKHISTGDVYCASAQL